MKKIFAVFFTVFALVVLAACGGKKEFAVDGEFTAFEHSVHGDAQMVTSVTVKIEKGKIVSYFIDARQAKKVVTPAEGETPEKVDYVWNEKTKKELGPDYGMKGVGPEFKFENGEWVAVEGGKSKTEWDDQAKAIEAAWLKNGVDSLHLTDGRIDNVATVTIKDGGYIKLAKEAVENAKAGKFQAYLCVGTDLYFATAVVTPKGKIESLVIDTRQMNKTATATEGKFVWNEKTKQELGAEYGMKDVGPEYKFENGEWALVEGGKSKTEWNDQVKVISDYIVKNGYVAFKSIGGRGVSLDGTKLVDNTASVTIKTDNYYKVLADLFTQAKLAE